MPQYGEWSNFQVQMEVLNGYVYNKGYLDRCSLMIVPGHDLINFGWRCTCPLITLLALL